MATKAEQEEAVRARTEQRLARGNCECGHRRGLHGRLNADAVCLGESWQGNCPCLGYKEAAKP